jgi:hypothetical protein
MCAFSLAGILCLVVHRIASSEFPGDVNYLAMVVRGCYLGSKGDPPT